MTRQSESRLAPRRSHYSSTEVSTSSDAAPSRQIKHRAMFDVRRFEMRQRNNSAGRSPVADPAAIDMDETRARIVADAAAAQRHRGAMHVGEVASWHADVRRHPVHMKTVGGHGLAVRVQHRVGLRRAIAGNQVERRARVERVMERVEQVEEAAIDVDLQIEAKIAHQVIDRLQALGNILIIGIIDRLQRLAGVKIVERKRTLAAPETARQRMSWNREPGQGSRAKADEAATADDRRWTRLLFRKRAHRALLWAFSASESTRMSRL